MKGTKLVAGSVSSNMCENWDSYRLMVTQWFHIIHSRVSAAAQDSLPVLYHHLFVDRAKCEIGWQR